MTAARTDAEAAMRDGGTPRSAAERRSGRKQRHQAKPASAKERATDRGPGADVDERLGEPATEPFTPLTPEEIADIEARVREHKQYWDSVYQKLRGDAQSCVRSMQFSPLFGKPAEWDDIVARSLDDYRSGRSLMDHLGADRLIDPALTGMLLAIRRGLIEEAGAVSMSDYVLIDMAVIAFANATRVQSVIGNTALVVESEMFCQPTLRAKWRKEYGSRPEDIRGLAVEDHVKQLRETLLPLAERFSRMAQEAVDGLRRQRREPSIEVERAPSISIRLLRPDNDERRAIPNEKPVDRSVSNQGDSPLDDPNLVNHVLSRRVADSPG